MDEELTRNIYENKKFEIIKHRLDGGRERYVSHFLSIEPEFYIIATPEYDGRRYELTVGKEINLYIYASNGVYSAMSKVLDVGLHSSRISLLSNIQQSQRREFLRVSKRCRVDLKIHREGGSVDCVSTLSVDLSGRGVGLLLDYPIGNYTKIELEISLDKQVIQTFAEFCHHRRIETTLGVKYRTGLMFISVTDKDIDAIVKECLLFQLQEKKRMLESGIIED